MTDHVVSGLVRKYAELAGRLRKLTEEAEAVSVEMEHIKVTIRLFDPGYPVGNIPPRRPKRKHQLAWGAIGRISPETYYVNGIRWP